MTESEAREECRKRGRNPDREMTGPQGTFKAWELYDLVNELNHKPDETQD